MSNDDDAFAPSKPFPTRSEFIGTGGPVTSQIGGHAQEIQDLAYMIRGEYELHYIPLNSEVSWMAGKTFDEIAAMWEEDSSLHDQFRRNGPYAQSDEGGNGRYLGTAEEWQKIRDEVEWVEGFWSDVLGPDPDAFDEIVTSSAEASKAIYDQSTGVDATGAPWQSASSALEEWDSVAARAFRDHVWNRLPSIVRRQAGAAAILAHAVSAERAMWSRHRRDLREIAEQTKVALNAVKVEEPDNAPANLTVLAGVFTVAAGLATIPFTGGVSTAAVVAGVSTVAAGVATVAAGEASRVDGERTEVPLGDETVLGVLFNMAGAGGQLSTEIRQSEQVIVDGLQSLHEKLTDDSSAADESGVDTSDLPPQFQPRPNSGARLTPRKMYVFPKPALIDKAGELPAPPIST